MTTFARLPNRMRIFEMAKRLDVPAMELLRRANRLEIEAQSVLKAIDRTDMQRILEDYRTGAGDSDAMPDPRLVDELLSTFERGSSGPDASVGVKPVAFYPGGSQGGTETANRQTVAIDQEPETLDIRDRGSIEDAAADEGEESTQIDLRDEILDDADDERPTSPEPVEASTEAPDIVEVADIVKVPEVPAAEEVVEDTLEDTPTTQDEALRDALGRVADLHPEASEEQLESPDTAVAAATERVEGRHGRWGFWRRLDARARIIATGVGIITATMLLTTVYAILRPTYAAESEIVITIAGLGSEEIQRELQSFAVVASSQTVLAPVAEEFGMSVRDVRESFEAAIVADSTVLRFSTVGDSPEEALALNEAITESYLEVANAPLDQSELTFVADRIDQVTAEMTTLDSELSQLEAEEAAQAANRLRIESERSVAQAQLADLEGRLVDLRASGAAPPGSITFVEGQINDTETRLAELVTEAQALESEDAAVRSAANRLRDERAVLRAELGDLQALHVQLELDQLAGTRVAVLAPGHATDEAVGLTPVRAAILGLLVGAALAFAWVVAATQLRKKR